MEKSKKIFLAFGFAICVLLFGESQTYAQVASSPDTVSQSNIKGPLQFKGFAKELSKKLKGAVVTLYESPDGSKDNLVEILKTVTSGNGQFDFKLEINKHYVLSVEKGGYTTKKIDFDTDVTMARENNTSVPTFSFEVDMVQDLDGLDFAGSVASVFYQIKRNEFDYQLDYSKEEMEEEERMLREQEEKRRLAELAAQKKFEMEEAARLLREDENATAQQIIKAAVTVGDGDRAKTVKGFLGVFSEVDTLREEKAEAMYDKLIAERKSTEASGGEINFQAIFGAATALEEEVVKAAEEEQSKSVAILRQEKEEAQRKMEEAQAIQQEALELEAREKMAAAAKAEELRRATQEKERKDKVYYAIFEANGDADLAIQNLEKTYERNDPYKEEKAKAIYAEYEKTRLTGTTLSKMDFGALFSAADEAESEAIKKDIDKDNFKQQSKLDAFMEKVEEKKQEEQAEVVRKIEEGLKTAPIDRASQVEVFKQSLPKNESYKDEKANAMYDEYVKQKQNLGGSGTVGIDFGSLFSVAEETEAEIQRESKEQLVKEKRVAQDKVDAQREQIRKEKAELAKKTAEIVEEQHRAVLAQTKDKKQKKLASALENGAGSREESVEEILKVLDSTGDKELDYERAGAIFDTYLKESQRIQSAGGGSVDFAVLFQAADKAELARLERQYEQKQAVEQEKLAEYTEQRIEKATEIAKAQQKQAEQQVQEAEKTYEETLLKVESQREERLAEQRKKEEELAKNQAMELAKREAVEKEKAAAERAKIKEERAKRLEEERKKQEELLAAENAERRKQEELAQQEADLLLAQAEKAQKEAEESARRAEEERIREEQKRLEAEAKSRKEAELAVAKAAEEERKAELKRKAAEEKAKQETDLALAKAAEEAANEELRRKEAEQEALKQAELVLAKAAEEARKAEEKARLEQELAAQKELERKEREAAEKKAAEEKAKRDAELAQAKAAEEARKAEEKARLEQELAAQKELERKEREAAEKKAAEEKAQREAELAQAKAAAELLKAEEQRLKEEQKRKEAEEKARLEEELAAKKELERKEREAAEQKAAEEKAQREAELAAAKKAEEERKAEEKRQLELAKQQAEEAERQRKSNFESLIVKGDGAFSTDNYSLAIQNYQDAKKLYPDDKNVQSKIEATQAELDRVAKEQAAQLALDKRYNEIMTRGNEALAANKYQSALDIFNEAASLKPDQSEPKKKISQVQNTLDEIAEAEKAEQAKERKFVLLMQEGSTAMNSGNYEVARSKFEEASSLKPEDSAPGKKLGEVDALEEELAAAEAEKKRKEIEAKKKFEEAQKLEEQKQAEELAARMKALEEADAAGGKQAANEEEARIAKYEQLKQSIEQMDLAAEQQRKAFLSELAKIYPAGMTKERVEGKNFVLLRYVINKENVVTIYEKKTWDWGGVFYFKDSDIAITEAIYKLEIGKYE